MLDKQNRSTKWLNSTKLELELMIDFHVFKDCGYNAPVPDGYKITKVHFIYGVKHGGYHLVKLVADGHLQTFPMTVPTPVLFH